MPDTPIPELADQTPNPAQPEQAQPEPTTTPDPSGTARAEVLADLQTKIAELSTGPEQVDPAAVADLDALKQLAQEAIDARARTKTQVDEMMSTITALRGQLRAEAVAASAAAVGAIDAEAVAALLPSDAETPDQVRDAVLQLKDRKPHLFTGPAGPARGVLVDSPQAPTGDGLGDFLAKSLGL